MKKSKNDACSLLCCNRPDVALWLVRIGVAIMFIVPGLMKAMEPAMFRGMLENVFGATGATQDILFWLVTGVEILGGLALVAGKMIPDLIYRSLALGLFIILMVALGAVHIPAVKANPAAMMGLLLHIQLALATLAMVVTKPMCPCGISGDKAK